MNDAVKQFLIVAVATLLGSLAAQYLVNNNRTVRRAVGGL